MKILLANPGVQHAYQLAAQLHRRDALLRFHTSFAVGEGSMLAKTPSHWLPAKVRKVLCNRTVPGVPASLLHSHPILEAQAMLLRRIGARDAEAFRARNIAFQRAIPASDIKRCDAVVGSDTSSEILAERAAAAGRPFVLSRSIGEGRAWNRVVTHLRKRWPDWGDTLDEKSHEDLASEDQEHEAARFVVAPSRFVAETLVQSGVSRSKVLVNPFGCPGVPSERRRRKSGAEIVFLFVGAMTARKGVPVLLEAWQAMRPRHAQLWLAGPGMLPESAMAGAKNVRLLGGLSRIELTEIYARADVFVFPSLFEGFAKVLGEAASAGLPLIATRASGAEEIIEDGCGGFLINEESVDDTARAMERFLEKPDLIDAASLESIRASRSLTWENYGNNWIEFLDHSIWSNQTEPDLG